MRVPKNIIPILIALLVVFTGVNARAFDQNITLSEIAAIVQQISQTTSSEILRALNTDFQEYEDNRFLSYINPEGTLSWGFSIDYIPLYFQNFQVNDAVYQITDHPVGATDVVLNGSGSGVLKVAYHPYPPYALLFLGLPYTTYLSMEGTLTATNPSGSVNQSIQFDILVNKWRRWPLPSLYSGQILVNGQVFVIDEWIQALWGWY